MLQAYSNSVNSEFFEARKISTYTSGEGTLLVHVYTSRSDEVSVWLATSTGITKYLDMKVRLSML